VVMWLCLCGSRWGGDAVVVVVVLRGGGDSVVEVVVLRLCGMFFVVVYVVGW